MPIYEYLCQSCNRSFSFLVGVGADAGEPQCPRCGGRELTKLISRIARIKSKGAALDDLADPSKLGNLDDPKAMADWARKMGRAMSDEMGEDFNEEEMEEMLENPEAADEAMRDRDDEE
ncbi:MAG TPA: zinc ribbon domain-containing protein [Candidatus Acidoferrales bacterium]|nr:zinc ribbon domain-containing protein [Candidatus Acidoferrales bacterium]